MMIELFSVFDAAASRFIDPYCAVTIDSAIRSFKRACQGDTPFAEFPEDYSLYHVGSFDQELGELREMKAHKIAMASSFVPSGIDVMRGADTEDVL